MYCTVIGPNLHTSKIVTAISVSERLLEMAAFYTRLRFTLTVFPHHTIINLESTETFCRKAAKHLCTFTLQLGARQYRLQEHQVLSPPPRRKS